MQWQTKLSFGAIASRPDADAVGVNGVYIATDEGPNIYISDGVSTWTDITPGGSAVLDGITATQGAILYRGASEWEALAPGTSGKFLKTQGAAANPLWDTPAGGGGGGAFELAGTNHTSTGIWDQSVDGSLASVEFDNLDNYSEIQVILAGVSASASGVRRMEVSDDNGSSFFTTSGDYNFVSSAGAPTDDTLITLIDAASAAARWAAFTIFQWNQARLKYCQNTLSTTFTRQFIKNNAAVALNSIRVYNDSGTLNGGVIYCYGRPSS